MSNKKWEPLNSIGDKLDQAFRSAYRSKRKTKGLVEDISNDKYLSMFFGRISENFKLKKMFFLHRADLFDSDSDYPAPYLLFCNVPDDKSNKKSEDESKALQHFVKEELGFMNPPLQMKFLKDTFGVSETNWKDMIGDYLDIFLYFGIKFIRSNPDLKAIINADDFNYQKMRELLGNPVDFLNLEDPQNIFNTLTPEPAIQKKMEYLATRLGSGIMKSFETGTLPTMNPDYKILFQLPSRIRVRNLLQRSKLSFEEYQSVLDELHRYHLLENVQTITWCENCSLEGLSFSQHKGPFAPSKITRDSCINCEKPKDYSAMFSLHPLLRDAIFAQDGFLGIYFGWLLKTNFIDFKAGEYSKKFENDFLVRNNILIECKMFKTDRDKITVRSRLNNCLTQIKNHISDLIEGGVDIKRAFLLWNQSEDTETILKNFTLKHIKLFEKYKLQIIPPNRIERLVSIL